LRTTNEQTSDSGDDVVAGKEQEENEKIGVLILEDFLSPFRVLLKPSPVLN
jgi:hypothetical protein